MRIGELARLAGVTTKAVRYYESLGLLVPHRLPNGYRDYDEGHLRVVIEIRELAATGISARQAAPFVECLGLGHEHGDDCVSSLAAYRDSIAEIDRIVAILHTRRTHLAERLEESASRTFTKEKPLTDYVTLPAGLPVPQDDGAAAHLPGLGMPSIDVPASGGGVVRLGDLGSGRTVIYLYPLTGRPGSDLPEGWTRSRAHVAAPPRPATSATTTTNCARSAWKRSTGSPVSRPHIKQKSWIGSGCRSRCSPTNIFSSPMPWTCPPFALPGMSGSIPG